MALRLILAPRTLLRPVPRIQVQTPIPFPAVSPSRFRSMATGDAKKYEWLVVVPDKPGMQAKRLEVRPDHFRGIKAKEESGQWKMGGAIFSEVPAGDDPSAYKFVGSTLVVLATDKEDVLSQLAGDIYNENGVWDLEKVQMWPLKTAFRNP